MFVSIIPNFSQFDEQERLSKNKAAQQPYPTATAVTTPCTHLGSSTAAQRYGSSLRRNSSTTPARGICCGATTLYRFQAVKRVHSSSSPGSLLLYLSTACVLRRPEKETHNCHTSTKYKSAEQHQKSSTQVDKHPLKSLAFSHLPLS